MKNYGKYGEVALKTVESLSGVEILKREEIIEEWNKNFQGTKHEVGKSPRPTFIYLCEVGLIKNIKVKYKKIKETENGKYGVVAVDILSKSNNIYSTDSLWKEVNKSLWKNVSHNNQMNVVMALFENGKLEI